MSQVFHSPLHIPPFIFRFKLFEISRLEREELSVCYMAFPQEKNICLGEEKLSSSSLYIGFMWVFFWVCMHVSQRWSVHPLSGMNLIPICLFLTELLAVQFCRASV